MKKLLVVAVVMATLGVLFVAALVAPTIRREVPRDSLDALMEAYHEDGTRHGINAPFNGVVLVADGDDVMFHEAYGVADAETGAPLSPDARFLIGQVTMQFTAMLVLQQVDRGVLSLDQTVADWIPGLAEERAKDWTLERLLNHTAGLTGDAEMRFSNHGDDGEQATTPREFVEKITRVAPGHGVGEDSRVSTIGYSLLGLVLEQATGKSYAELLQENIAAPLGLKNTGFADNAFVATEVVADYRFSRANPFQTLFMAGDGSMSPAQFRDQATTFAGAGMHSTAEDLLRWTQALRRGELLSPELSARMTTPDRWGYGYGIYRNQEELFRILPDAPLLSHDGRVAGYRAFVGIYDSGMTVIVLANCGPMDVIRLSRNVYLTAQGDPDLEELRHPAVGNVKRFDEAGGTTAFINYYRDLSRRAGYPICPTDRTLAHAIGLQLRTDRKADALRMVEALSEPCAPLSDGFLNLAGYEFLRDDYPEEALQVLRLNAELHPQVPNVHDSLGEALEANDQIEAARRSYARAVELGTQQEDSSVATYRRHLERLDRAGTAAPRPELQ